LLDPTRQHGFGTRLLGALLGHLAKSLDYTDISVQEVLAEHRLLLSGKSLGRLDVFGTGTWTTSTGATGNWLLAIEAKIDAGEGDNQLERYDEWINAHSAGREVFRVFLTPSGRGSGAEGTDWLPMSYLDLVRVFRKQYPQLRDRHGFHFLRYYLTGFLKDICRWNVPVAVPDTCDDPYGMVSYLKTVHSSNRGERTHDSAG
jgi:hypothetical protein